MNINTEDEYIFMSDLHETKQNFIVGNSIFMDEQNQYVNIKRQMILNLHATTSVIQQKLIKLHGQSTKSL